MVRRCIEALVRREGGDYTGSLDQRCTHLVVDSPSGEKYLACCSDTLLAHVRIVSPAWLAACLARGVCVDAANFAIHPAVSSSSSAPALLDASFGPRLLAQSVPEQLVGSGANQTRALFNQTRALCNKAQARSNQT